MPNPSQHLSSVLAIPKQDQNNQVENSSAVVDNQTEVENEANDWFYGTEELLDALPKLWTRSMLYFLVIFTSIILPWSMLTKIDETGSARGRLEPKGATHQLGISVPGTVKAVNVQEGAMVKAGQVLLELDSDILEKELQQRQTQLQGLSDRQAQLKLLKNQLMLAINIQEQQNQAQELEKMSQVNQAQQNLDARQSALNLQRLERQALVEQARQNINSTQTAEKLVNSRFNRDVAEVARFRELYEQGAIPQIQLVELEKTAEDSQRLHLQAQSDVTQAQLRLREEMSRYQATMSQVVADIEQAKLRLQEQQSSYQSIVQAGKLAVLRSQEQLKDMETQISSLSSEISQTKSQIASLQIQMKQRIVRSPIDGIVFELPISKAGPVVDPGQIVAQIAPQDSKLILKAQIPSQHSGFLEEGMPVKIKFDAYPYQDYGVMEGRVSWIAPNSRTQSSNQGSIDTYDLDITLDQPYVQTANQRVNLTPGQTATAEVVIRQRRVIDFILDPFKKLQQGGLEL
ncbi:HlyD family efflux transporter periplasmic adaptor subunit [Nodularia spumigena]|jgi:HlyD family secretion protein|uniref:HlyD family efflux transporter periplasmic adaptor subunit n=1 Tax=Nodularia spumigena TaxID=70799 RepID=UPI000D325849|nr:HlyD family efflux transporter periplasmic adaptor subunit [Nodularia spumigena]